MWIFFFDLKFKMQEFNLWLKCVVQGVFLGGPVVRVWHFHCRGLGSIPCRGTKIPQAAWCGQKIYNIYTYIYSRIEFNSYILCMFILCKCFYNLVFLAKRILTFKQPYVRDLQRLSWQLQIQIKFFKNFNNRFYLTQYTPNIIISTWQSFDM